MNTYNYAIELAREIISERPKDIVGKIYMPLRTYDTEYYKYKDDYIEVVAGINTKALHVEIYKPLTNASSNPIIYVDDSGKCFRNHGERENFCLYAELLLNKQRTIFFSEWGKKQEEAIKNLFKSEIIKPNI